ncbi:monosaccharide-P-dolichol utilization protein [Glomus cerebriforme]|uniref:Mannose-P-dolichol utilization defect 1 protein homolog n=1 Tax=Glomus cerebriforme TaxID=658196 RepID=A0A397SP58_9GLOM|nr:monosaccharide-P-dolichol utilization protein [Glomus cerebriforme]RIA86019.1 monosaccharide-P-dolichol utilization protein [Glomus cerebriforme]
MFLPDIIKAPAVQLIGEKCYMTLVEDLDITDVACLKHLLSKGLGFGIVLGGALVKLPQIFKILSAGSARGLSLTSSIMETFAMGIGLAYNFRQGNPFTTFGELIFLTIQNIIILLLILNYSGRSRILILTGITIVAISYALGSPMIISNDFLSFLQAITIPIGLSSKVPQIITNLKNGSTGQLSSFAVFGFTAGSLARIFTTLSEVDDDLILTGYVLASVLNVILTIQMIRYWNVEKMEKISTEKED